MGQPAKEIEHEQRALDDRINEIVAAHGGNWRAAIEVLLLVSDARSASISYGYVRGRSSDEALVETAMVE